MPSDLHVPFDDADQQYDNFFKQLTKLQKGDIIFRANCKFCNHPVREEAEQKWERMGNFSAVERLFDEYRKNNPEAPKMNFVNIKGHLLNHYEGQKRKIRIREYGEFLLEMMNERIEKDKMLDGIITSLFAKYMDLISDNEIDTVKQGEIATKVAKAITDAMKVQSDIRGDTGLITVFTKKFEQTSISVINAETNELVRERLVDFVDILQREMQVLPRDDSKM